MQTQLNPGLIIAQGVCVCLFGVPRRHLVSTANKIKEVEAMLIVLASST